MSEKIQYQTLSSWTPAHINWLKVVSQSPVSHKQRVQSKSPRGWINPDRAIRRSRNKEVKDRTPTSFVQSQTLSSQKPVPQTLVETVKLKQLPLEPEQRVPSSSSRNWINPDASIRRSRNKEVKNWTPTSCVQNQTQSTWTPVHMSWVKSISQSPVNNKQQFLSNSPCVQSQTLSSQTQLPQTLVETIRPTQSSVVPKQRIQTRSSQNWINPNPSIRRSRSKGVKNWTPTSCREWAFVGPVPDFLG